MLHSSLFDDDQFLPILMRMGSMGSHSGFYGARMDLKVLETMSGPFKDMPSFARLAFLDFKVLPFVDLGFDSFIFGSDSESGDEYKRRE